MRGTALIKPFDPWRGKLCSCPPKYSLNPYTGCAHSCVYCYASSYIPHFFRCRPKRDLLARVARDVLRLPSGALLSLCNTSDPYPPMERELGLTRSCLDMFQRCGFRVLVITKSDLVVRDADILAKMPSAVSITVTTLRLWQKLEPGAPPPERRLSALKALSSQGIPTSLRLDPIFPYLTEGETEEIVAAARESGARHITSSTFKPRPDSWKRLAAVFPEAASQLYELYFLYGEKEGNSWYLPRSLRRELMLRVREACHRLGLSFSSCREGFPELNTAPSCDGSHVISTPYFTGTAIPMAKSDISGHSQPDIGFH